MASLLSAAELVVVERGKAVVTALYLPADVAEDSQLRYGITDFVTAVKAMSGAELAVVEVPEGEAVPAGAGILLGRLAVEAGASPRAPTLWKDSARVIIKDGRLLIGGDSDQAVHDALMELLHEQGVRYFLPENIPNDPGTVYPTVERLAWEERDVNWHPFVRGRRVWGHNMGSGGSRRASTWVRRNAGVSVVDIPTSHAWSGLIPKEKQKPEHFAIKRYDADGTPQRGGQFCVSHPEVPELVAATLIARFDQDPEMLAQSISPNDGGGACICFACQALDAPGYLEPSSGKPVLTDRYLHLFNAVAERVAAKYPDRYLSYLVYSDYSRPPRIGKKVHPMIVPVFAPIRYPRMQSMFNPQSEQNIRLRHEIDAFTKSAEQIGYYGYNYNLAETIVPFSKLSIWSEELPFLATKELIQATFETLGNWNSNGPHIYLSTRYLVSGDSPEAIIEDYFTRLGGAAAPAIKAYWMAVDDYFRTSDIHSGAFYGIEQILTPDRLAVLQSHLDAADKAAATDRERAVVAFFRSGLEQGKLTIQLINQLNQPDFAAASATHEELYALNDKLEKDGTVSRFPNQYMGWFITHVVKSGQALLDSGGTIELVLPETWLYRPDFYDVGIEEEWANPNHRNNRWKAARQWGAPSMYSQGFEDWKGYQWFKVEIDLADKPLNNLMMWFGANDGTTRLWVNGEGVPFVLPPDRNNPKPRQAWEHPNAWRSFAVPVGKFLRPGANTIVVRLNHQLNDLNLGGFLRPVLLYAPGEKELQEVEDTYQKMEM